MKKSRTCSLDGSAAAVVSTERQKQHGWRRVEVCVIHHMLRVLCEWREFVDPSTLALNPWLRLLSFQYQALLSHSGRLHINLCEKIIKGLFLSSQSFSSYP